MSEGPYQVLVTQPQARHIYADDAHTAIAAYLDEKGVEYELSLLDISSYAKGMRVVKLIDVPAKLFHRVVVPGLREECKRWCIDLVPEHYDIEAGDTRYFSATLYINWEKVNG